MVVSLAGDATFLSELTGLPVGSPVCQKVIKVRPLAIMVTPFP